MFDHEGVKNCKSDENFSILFSQAKYKKLVTKKNEAKRSNMHNPNQFMASQNLLYDFLK